MTTLRVIVDEIFAPVPTGVSRYAEDLTRAIIDYAPAGCDVEGVVSAATEQEYADLERRLPGLSGLYKTALARRELVAAWQHGFTRLPGGGMIHAPSLLAPLSRHDRINARGQQTVVTLHDVVAWTHPEALPARSVSWFTAMAKRAHKYADALVVPTHAVAAQLGEFLDFGDRVRVIGGAVSTTLHTPLDAEARAAELALPERYLLAMGGIDSRRGIDHLIRALALPAAGDLPLLIVGADDDGAIAAAAAETGLAIGRVRTLGRLSDPDLSVALDRATLLVFPSIAEGFGMPLLEAFHFGTPVVHSNHPAVVEVSGDAGLAVTITDIDGYSERLADAIGRVVTDPELAARLSIAGRDRASLFSWRASADKVWQLHADL